MNPAQPPKLTGHPRVGALGALAIVLMACSATIAPSQAAPTSGAANQPRMAFAGTSSEPTATPEPTPQPSSLDPEAGLTYSCSPSIGAANGEPFDPALLSRPPDAVPGPDPAAAPVASVAATYGLQPTHWWLVFRSPTLAQFLGQGPSGTYDYVLTTLNGDGTWGFNGLGDCPLKYWADRRSTLTWWIDPSNLPKPGDREIHAIVIDPCVPASLVGRIGKPVIRYASQRILIALTATSAPGSDVCSNGPALAFIIKLDEPIGQQALFDGGTWPGRDARLAVR